MAKSEFPLRRSAGNRHRRLNPKKTGMALRVAVGLAVLVGLAGCQGSDQAGATKKVMPDVMGRRLDVALSDIKRAGFEEKVEVVGGGTLGIVVKSNWTVCDQLPAAGEAFKEPPRLTVDRSCGGNAAESSSPPTTATIPATVPTTVRATPTTVRATPTTVRATPTTEYVTPATEEAPRTAAYVPPAPSSPTGGSTPYYANCDAVRAAGQAPLHRGDPGYRSGLDRDNDGVACE